MGICMDIFFITYQVAFLPGIRIWHNKQNGVFLTVEDVNGGDEDDASSNIE